MKDMTLREIYQTFGVSRRAIQGYEKAGLILASGKNERGHLLYAEASQERIQKIKLFQQMGFSLKEIKNIIDAPTDVLKPILEQQVQKLQMQKEGMDLLIQKVNELIEELQLQKQKPGN